MKEKVEYVFENNLFEKSLDFRPTSRVTKDNLNLHIEMNYFKNLCVEISEIKEKEKDSLSTQLKEYYEQKIAHFIELSETKAK